MESLNQVFTISNILESGLINIICLLIIVSYFIRNSLGSALEQRQKEIFKKVQDAEERLNGANIRLNNAQKQLDQTKVIIREIKQETIKTKINILISTSDYVNDELASKFKKALVNLRTREEQIFNEIREQIILITLINIVNKIKIVLTNSEQLKLIDRNINKLDKYI